MKRFLSAILILSLLFVFASATGAFAVVYGKSGYESHGDFEDDPWEIDSAATLVKFRDDFNQILRSDKLPPGKYLKLTADIDLTSYTDWGGIGYWDPFDGTFDGNGHTIKLRISRSDSIFVGLFSEIKDGTVKNLHVTGIVKGTRSGEYDDIRVGGITGQLSGGTIDNCTFDGTISGKAGYKETKVGGIVGLVTANKVTITNCKVGAFSDTSITAGTGEFGTWAGGIIGYFESTNNSVVSNNFIRATLEANDKYQSYAHTGLVYAEKKNSGGTAANNEEVDPDSTDPEVNILTEVVEDGFLNTDYAVKLEANIDDAKWSWYGNTPAGLKLDTNTGNITGKPTVSGTYLFDVTARKDGYVSATKIVSITILSEEEKAVRITTTSLPNGTKNNSYVGRLQSNVTGVTWEWSGNTPQSAALSLNASSGAITGTPIVADSYTFVVTASKSGYRSGSKTFTIVISGMASMSITTSSLENGAVGENYAQFLDASEADVTWSWKGHTPDEVGLTLDNVGGYIYGTPRAGRKFTFTIIASKSGYESAEQEYTITITGDGTNIASTFTDANFRAYVAGFDTDGDGYLNDSEVAAVKSISIKNKNISSLDGIGVFTSLEELICDDNNLRTLDLSANTALKALYCSSNNLTSLNLSNNKLLETLECDNNMLSVLDVSQNTALDYLSCAANELTKLDVSANTALRWLYCHSNNLNELVLGKNSVLEEVNCESNDSLKTLDISGCTKLTADNIQRDSELQLKYGNSGIETPEIDGYEELPEFGGSTLVLDGKIGINFYVYIPDGYNPEDCYMVFESRRGVSNENPTEKYNPEAYAIRRDKKYYAYTCYINSAQMAEDVTATFHFNDKTITKTDSVEAYLTLAKQYESQFSDNVNNLMKAIRNYGHYVQPMLSINGSWTIGDMYAEISRASEITDADIEDAKASVAQYAKVEYKNSTGITRNAGYSLNLDTETILNITFTPVSTYTGSVSITVDGKAYEATQINENGTIKHKIEIKNISAPDLNKTFSIIAEANGMNMLEISAMSYVQAVLNANVSQVGNVPIDIMKQAVTALYNYHAAAKTYFDSGKQ